MRHDWPAEFQRERERRGVAPFSPDLSTYECLVSSIKEYAVFLLDSDGHIMSWNPGARRIKQYQADEVIGRHFRMLYTPDDHRAGRPEKNLLDTLRNGQTEDIGWRRKKDGTLFWADAVITPIVDPAGHVRGFAKIIRDLTEINIAERRVRDTEVRRQVDRLKNEFLGLVSHELRTPLTVIQGYADLLEEGSAGPTTDTQHDYLVTILRLTGSLTRMINDMIDITQLRAGTLQLTYAPLNLAEAVQAAVFAMQSQAQEKHLWLASHVNPDLPDVPADAQRLSQVLLHLIDNAIKFTAEGGHIDIRACIDGPEVRCEIADSGEGIAPDQLERLFRDFGQVDMSTTRPHGGLGIGLSISKRLIEAHGGHIGLLSAVGQGTTCWFTLPLEQPSVRITRAPGGTPRPAGP